MSRQVATDRDVAAVIKSSAVFDLFDRALGHVWRAASGSVAASAATQAASGWTGLEQGSKRLVLGTMLIVAVAAHLVFTLATEVPAGWLWLILPGITGSIGLLLVMAARLPGVTRN